MQATSNLPRILSAALAVACSIGLLTVVGEELNPRRLAVNPQVFQLDPVVVKAPLQPALTASVSRSATN